MEELIKDFECHLTLMADDLHDIVSHSNSIVQYIKEHESEWSRNGTGNNVQITPIGNEGRRIARYKIDDNPEGYIYAPTTTSGLNGDTTIIEPLNFSGSKVAIANFVAGNESGTLYAPAGGGSGGGGNDGQDGLSTLFAFKGFASDSDAETDWNINFKNSRNYPPGNVSDGWSTSSNVPLQTGHMLYMTTAQRQGNNYITTNGAVWQKPVRIGSGSDTSHTGTDDDNYNYIYCRTTSNVVPGLTGVVGQSSYGVHLLELIEADSNKGNGYKPNSDTPINISSATVDNINEAWIDHPYGVSSQLPFEWQVGFKKNEESGNWEYYFGPVIISHYGHDGLDGDGLEYIFYLQPKNLAGIPSLGAPYEGRIGENGPITLTKVSVNSTDYQLDDFIPTGWHDNPQTISELYPRQYVSIRKKEGALEADNLWQAFTPPRLWNIYATNGFLATLNNDSIILDDDNGSEAIEFVSLTKAFLWDGANDVTLSSNYSKVTVTIKCNGFENELRPGYVTSVSSTNVDISPETDWETEMEINRSDYKGFALTKRASGKLPIKTGSITYTIRAYETGSETPKIEASRILTLLVVDINNGVAYQLLVTPNTLGVYRDSESSPYNFRDVSSITVTATAASETSVEKIEIKNGSSNANDKDLYIVVSDSGGTPLNIPSPTWYSDSKSLVYNLLSFSGGGTILNGLQYIVVDLYYRHLDLGIKVDSETVDFSAKGDKGPAGQGSGTESYVITTLNDNAVIDDLTTNDNALAIATLNTLTVYKGNEDVTSNCTFVPIMIDLPSELQLRTYSNGLVISLDTLTNINSFVIGYVGDKNITPGNYYYDIDIIHDGETRATKRFKLYVDANISADGSFYKLSITNDIVNYDSERNSLSDSNIVISAYKISLDGTSTKENIISKGISSPSSSNGLYVKFDNSSLDDIASLSNGEITISRTSIPYNANGYDVTLYNGNFYADGPEHIDCIKDGAPGDNGKDSTVYGLEPYPTVLKFNVASDGTTLTPSELVARCKISKTVGDVTTLYDNNTGESDPYYMYYNITTSDGEKINISQSRYTYVLYNNSDNEFAGIHVNTSSSNLTYISVNFYLAKASGDILLNGGADSINIIKQVSVPILRDGLKGSSTGQTGRFYYFAGDWNDVTDGLIVTNTRCPYVYYGGDYYMYIGTDTGNPLNKSSLGNPTGDNWEKMTYNKFAISEAMFSNYAKLGAAIFNRDWMISQYGSVNGVPSTNFSSFDPVEFMCKIKGYAEIGAIYGGGSNTNKILSQLFRLTLDTFKITVTLTSAGGSVKLIRFNDDYLFKDVSGISVITSGADANASVIDTQSDSNSDLEIIFNNIQTLSDGVYCILASNSENVSSIKVEMPTVYLSTFVPNYALDLRSGLTYLNNAYIKGLVSTVNDLVVLKEESQNLSNWATVSDRGLFCRNDVDTPSPSLNEVLASIGVHKYTDNYGYTILSGEINLRRRLNRSSNWNYANLNGSGLTFAYHEGNSIPNLTEISALDIKTKLVIAPIIEGGYVFNGLKTPVAFPGNINLDAIVTLPKSGLVPYSGAIIFATNCKIVKVEDNSIVYNSEGQGETYSDTETALINSSALGGTHIFEYVSPRIFVGYYKDNILRWREFCCRQ